MDYPAIELGMDPAGLRPLLSQQDPYHPSVPVLPLPDQVSLPHQSVHRYRQRTDLDGEAVGDACHGVAAVRHPLPHCIQHVQFPHGEVIRPHVVQGPLLQIHDMVEHVVQKALEIALLLRCHRALPLSAGKYFSLNFK